MRRKLQEYPGISGTATVKLIKNSNAADMNNLCSEFQRSSDQELGCGKARDGRRNVNAWLLSGDASEKTKRDSSLGLPAQAGEE